MSMIGYPWDLEERVEDAIVAHIKALTGTIKMCVPWRTVTRAQYPLVVVQAETSDNHSDTGEFTGRRAIPLTVNIVTEAVNKNGPKGTIEYLQTARDAHRAIKSEVIGALAGTKTHDELNELGTEGVEFSQACITQITADAGDGKLTTMITVDVIAQPKEL